MELTRRNVIFTFTILCIAASMVVGFQYLGGYAYLVTDNFIKNQEAGVFRWLFWLFHSSWTETLVQYFFMMGVAYIPAYLILLFLPKDKRPVIQISGEDFMLCLVASMGLGYGLNIVGNFINMFIGMFTDKTIYEMNPVTDMATNMTRSMILYTCIVGPFMEELMFRGLLLKRARFFGDRTAVVFTAILFGLMHGNLSQFLYATAIGLIFGYVAVKTNSIRYSVAMHMLINSFSTLMSCGESLVTSTGVDMLAVLYMIGILATILFLIIAGIIVVVKYGKIWFRQMTYYNGPPCSCRKYVYLNPGFLIYFCICMIDFLYYLL